MPKNLRLGRPSPALVISTMALGAALAGPAGAAEQVAHLARQITGSDVKNGSVTGTDLKDGSVTGSDLKDGSIQSPDIGTGQIQTSDLGDDSVRGDKIQSNTVDGSDVQDDSLKGADIQESTLGTVPKSANASTADNADQLGGKPASAYAPATEHVRLDARLDLGQSVTVADAGGVQLIAECVTEGANDVIRLYAKTSVANSFMEGDNSYDGGTTPTDFLQPDTAKNDAELFEDSQATGGTTPSVSNNIDQGWILGSDGSYIGLDGEELAYGFNALGHRCVAEGSLNVFHG